MSRKPKNEYYRFFTVTDPRTHEKGHTEYKVTARVCLNSLSLLSYSAHVVVNVMLNNSLFGLFTYGFSACVVISLKYITRRLFRMLYCCTLYSVTSIKGK